MVLLGETRDSGSGGEALGGVGESRETPRL